MMKVFGVNDSLVHHVVPRLLKTKTLVEPHPYKNVIFSLIECIKGTLCKISIFYGEVHGTNALGVGK